MGRQDSGDCDEIIDVDYKRGFNKMFREVEETMGELCDILRETLWMGLRPHCAQKLFFSQNIMWPDIFWTDLV